MEIIPGVIMDLRADAVDELTVDELIDFLALHLNSASYSSDH